MSIMSGGDLSYGYYEGSGPMKRQFSPYSDNGGYEPNYQQ